MIRKHSYYNFTLTIPSFRDFKRLHGIPTSYYLVIVAYAPGILHTLFWILRTTLCTINLIPFCRQRTTAQRYKAASKHWASKTSIQLLLLTPKILFLNISFIVFFICLHFILDNILLYAILYLGFSLSIICAFPHILIYLF